MVTLSRTDGAHEPVVMHESARAGVENVGRRRRQRRVLRRLQVQRGQRQPGTGQPERLGGLVRADEQAVGDQHVGARARPHDVVVGLRQEPQIDLVQDEMRVLQHDREDAGDVDAERLNDVIARAGRSCA